MKTDIDSILEANHLDALLITGPTQHNPAMVYFTGMVHVTNADLVLPRGKPGTLYHGSMEREEAAKTGFKTRSYTLYPYSDYLTRAHNDRILAIGLRYAQMLKDAGVTHGRVALYGQTEVGPSFAAFNALQKAMPEIELVGFLSDEIVMKAMETKSAEEIARIRHMGQVTTAVVAETADFLSGRKVKDDMLYGEDDQPLTIGTVKSKIDLWLAERGAENPEGTIFSIGRDAGVPHSNGNPTDILRLGQTIVYDIFPCEAGGGYFYDFTRTWCLGYAPDEVQKLYEQVLAVHEGAVKALKPGQDFADSQRWACEQFAAMGHATIMQNLATEEGYVHSLGHGIGLHIHEKPFSSMGAEVKDRLLPGSVFTIEPGLYYPSRGMGIRLEDSYWLNPNGHFEVLADYPLDLVLPVKKQ
jgi:Xaa-Pro aminopeptidase